MFAGARGEIFEAKCEQIEQMFHDALDNVRSVMTSILDVQAPSWYDDILQFRTVIKDIEVKSGRSYSLIIPGTSKTFCLGVRSAII